MAEPDTALWSDAERALLDALLDQVIPASADGRMPAAGALGVADFIAAKLGDDPARTTELARAFADLPADAAEAERAAPANFSELVRLVYMGYYSRADVRPHFGLSDRPTQPEGYELPEDDPDELAALLAPVRARGRCYRPS